MTENNNKLPDTTEVENDDGTITRISFKYKNNQIIKTTTKYKLVKDTIKKSKRVIERNEKLKKFGNAKNDCNDITFVDNECKILTPSEWDDDDDNDDTNINENINNKLKKYYNKGKGKYNQGNNNQSKVNQSNYSQSKVSQANYSQNKGSQANYSQNKGSQANYSQSKGSYNDQFSYNYYSIRISNISNNITENDLYDLVSFFGSIKKIIIAKDKDTRKSKGYAFVNFSDKICAKNALDNLNGHGYDNMILKVEYSRNIN